MDRRQLRLAQRARAANGRRSHFTQHGEDGKSPGAAQAPSSGPSLSAAFAALHAACLPPFAAATATRELLALVEERPDLADEALVAIEIRVDERKARRQIARAARDA